MTIDDVLSGRERWTVECGDCVDVLKALPDECIDAVVTDPPYGLGTREPTVEELIAYLHGSSLDIGGDFMARDWQIPTIAAWRELLRVLKPGGYLLSFAGTRTVDLIGIGIRAAGFEIRDELSWTYGQGFPHGINISKAIDKYLGAKRKVVGTRQLTGNAAQTTKEKGGTYAAGTDARGVAPVTVEVTAPGSPEAERWAGWNTALKPCREPIIAARKPFRGTVVKNILKHGTGAMNVDSCRLGRGYGRPESWYRSGHTANPDADKIAAPPGNGINAHEFGRWPGNWLLSHADGCVCVGTASIKANGSIGFGTKSETSTVYNPHAAERGVWSAYGKNGIESTEQWDCVPWCPVSIVNRQSEPTSSHASGYNLAGSVQDNPAHFATNIKSGVHFADSGGVARYFNTFPYEPPWIYEPKADREEREKGCEHLPPGRTTDGREQINDTPFLRDATERRNVHPTVKPVNVMRWLCRLITQPGGVVLDPFTGSGSTGVAALAEGFRFIGVELDPKHCAISRARITGDMPLFNRQAGAR